MRIICYARSASFPSFAEFAEFALRERRQMYLLGVSEGKVGRQEDWRGRSRRRKQ